MSSTLKQEGAHLARTPPAQRGRKDQQVSPTHVKRMLSSFYEPPRSAGYLDTYQEPRRRVVADNSPLIDDQTPPLTPDSLLGGTEIDGSEPTQTPQIAFFDASSHVNSSDAVLDNDRLYAPALSHEVQEGKKPIRQTQAAGPDEDDELKVKPDPENIMPTDEVDEDEVIVLLPKASIRRALRPGRPSINFQVNQRILKKITNIGASGTIVWITNRKGASITTTRREKIKPKHLVNPEEPIVRTELSSKDEQPRVLGGSFKIERQPRVVPLVIPTHLRPMKALFVTLPQAVLVRYLASESSGDVLRNLMPTHTFACISAWIVWQIVYRLYLWPRFLSPLRTVPGPPLGGLLTGQFSVILKEEAGSSHCEWLKTYGPVVRVVGPIGMERLIFTKPTTLQKLLVAEWTLYPRVFFAGHSLVTVTGDEHRQMRKALSPAFSLPILLNQAEGFHGPINSLVEILKKEVNTESDLSRGKIIPLYNWLSKVTLDIIFDLALGYKTDCLHDPHRELALAFESISETQDGVNRMDA
ncbi:hypothetical protein ONZ45_g18293 [Pleurotus djamor]|nr:hypothetical protein ONZ45_g18293 [Pleurotus djamor]